MRSSVPAELARFARDCYLLSCAASDHDRGSASGREWEKAVSSLLWRPGLHRRQIAGTLGIFGRGSASGADHELDGAAHGRGIGIWIEAKAGGSLSKEDVAVFRVKCDDLYAAAVVQERAQTFAERWWPILVCKQRAPLPVRRLCISQRILLCDPATLPLPTILKVASNPEADMHLSETLLSEAVRLLEPACASMQDRLRLSRDGRSLVQDVADIPTHQTVTETIFIQDELSADLLDHLERVAPARLERRADELASRLLPRPSRLPALAVI